MEANPKAPPTRLPLRYLNKVFDFRILTDALGDARHHHPDIAASAVFRAVFHGFVVRGSFQQLESEIADSAFQRWIGVDRVFRDDVLR